MTDPVFADGLVFMALAWQIIFVLMAGLAAGLLILMAAALMLDELALWQFRRERDAQIEDQLEALGHSDLLDSAGGVIDEAHRQPRVRGDLDEQLVR